MNWLILTAVLALVGAMAIQHQYTRRLASDVAALRQELAVAEPAQPKIEARRERAMSWGDPAISQRLDALEQTVAQLVRNSEYLMERGQLPASANKVTDLFAKLNDPTAPDRDRLQALRTLRRSGGMSDDTVAHAVQWAKNATNADTRDDILSALEGLTNSVLREPLLAFAANDPDSSVREQALDSLRRFVSDPQVEAQFWKMINDPDEDIRDTAMDGIIEGPKTPERFAALEQRAKNPDGSLDERLLAWRALRAANQDVPDVSAALIDMAKTSQDPFQRARVIQAFDDAVESATGRDAPLLPPLVQGLQDPSPLVRERAADALNDFRADATVQQWLRYAAENDPDPAVRRQAARAITQNRR